MEPEAGGGSPLLREAGRRRVAADGVWKAATYRCRFAVTVVQSDLGRSSGPHPIRRFAPPSPASWGRGQFAEGTNLDFPSTLFAFPSLGLGFSFPWLWISFLPGLDDLRDQILSPRS